jgi:hypothetical protein
MISIHSVEIFLAGLVVGVVLMIGVGLFAAAAIRAEKEGW